MKKLLEYLQSGHIINKPIDIKGCDILAIDVLNDTATFLENIDDVKAQYGEKIYNEVQQNIKGFASTVECIADDDSYEYVFIAIA